MDRPSCGVPVLRSKTTKLTLQHPSDEARSLIWGILRPDSTKVDDQRGRFSLKFRQLLQRVYSFCPQLIFTSRLARSTNSTRPAIVFTGLFSRGTNSTKRTESLDMLLCLRTISSDLVKAGDLQQRGATLLVNRQAPHLGRIDRLALVPVSVLAVIEGAQLTAIEGRPYEERFFSAIQPNSRSRRLQAPADDHRKLSELGRRRSFSSYKAEQPEPRTRSTRRRIMFRFSPETTPHRDRLISG